MFSKSINSLCWIISLIMVIAIISCSDESLVSMEVPTVQKEEIVDLSKVVYPRLYPRSRSQNNIGFWESWTSITLRSGNTVNTPWNTYSSPTSVPAYITYDIQYCNGWDLIYNGIQQTNTLYHNYLVFHNRYTGILKVFYYMENSNSNNNAYWEVSTTQPSSLLAFQNDIIPLSSVRNQEKRIFNNLSVNEAHAFEQGWNCFQLELAYDSNQSGYLDIRGTNYNTTSFDFSGEISSLSQGTIVSMKKQSNTLSDLLSNLIGDKATQWIMHKLDNHSILGIPNSTIESGISSILTSAVSPIIGSIVGLVINSGETSTTSSLELTTKSSVTITGTCVSVVSGNINPLRLTLNPDTIGYLGVWCLEENPEVLYSPYATLKSPQQSTNGYTREYVSQIVQKKNPIISINPDVLPFITSYTVNKYLYQTDHITRYNAIGNGIGSRAIQPPYIQSLYEDIYQPNEYFIVNVAFQDEDGYIPVEQLDAPFEVYLPNVPNGPQSATPNIYFHSPFITPVKVTLNTIFGTTAISVHKTIPTVNWNYSEYNNGLYWNLYPNEPVVRLH